MVSIERARRGDSKTGLLKGNGPILVGITGVVRFGFQGDGGDGATGATGGDRTSGTKAA